jgi:hypothetical protein
LRSKRRLDELTRCVCSRNIVGDAQQRFVEYASGPVGVANAAIGAAPGAFATCKRRFLRKLHDFAQKTNWPDG